MIKEQYIDYIVPRIVIDSIQRNLLPSPRIAQSLFEPNFGTSELAINANNLFGLKNNDQWQGKCYNKITKECYDGIKLENINADFRAYDSWDESIIDQGDYLVNRWISKRNPSIKRFADLIGNKNYIDCAKILKESSYATDPTYSKKVINYINLYSLNKYDTMTIKEANSLMFEQNKDRFYRVQCGAFNQKENAINLKNKLNSDGIKDVIIKISDGFYKCQCGAFKNKSNAEDFRNNIITKGYNAFVVYY